MQRVITVVGALILLTVIGVGGWWAIDRFSEEEDAADRDEEVRLVSIPVIRTDLVDRETLDGVLRFGDSGTIVAQAAGTITALPEPGTVLERGDVAFEIDGRPVVVMFGRRPAWRPMSAGTGDGHDIMQLEANLLLLGYTADDFEVDREFTELTADLVSEWQADLEIEETGSVDLGRVLFLPRSVRIADIAVDLGMAIAPGTPLLTTTSTRQEVQLWLDADRQDLLDLDDIVGIELPDETVTTGTVANISDVVTTIGSGPDARRVFEVTIRLNDSTAAAGLDEAPVDVDVVSEEASDVLAVPVDALLALAEGGYAVQRLQSDGASEFVAVDIGKFADGLVAVTGDLREGDFVLVPR